MTNSSSTSNEQNPFISARQELLKSALVKPTFIASGLAARKDAYCSTHPAKLTLFCSTWNVAGIEACNVSSFLQNAGIEKADICLFGFQEIDTSTEAYLYADTPKSQAWKQKFMEAVGEEWECIGLHQMVGVLAILVVRKSVIERICLLDFVHLATGLLGVMGNKGAVACRFFVDKSLVSIITCHFAADIEMVAKRNSEWTACMNMRIGDASSRDFWFDHPWISPPGSVTDKTGVQVSQADAVIFLGDFNYRVTVPRALLIKALDEEEAGAVVRKWDQLNIERRDGRVFGGFKEAPVTFPPTYKYDMGTNEYDTSEKQRCPAWCDRILWRDDECIENLTYTSYMPQTESDHKPVSALFKIKSRIIDPAALETERTKLERRLDGFENEATPRVSVTPTSVVFGAVSCFLHKVERVTLENIGKVTARVGITYEGEWLSVAPSNCFLFPGERLDIIVTVKIPINKVQALNRGNESIEGVISFKVEDGKDVFLAVEAMWHPSSFGERMGVLGLVDGPLTTEGIQKAQRDFTNGIPGVTVPKQMSRLFDFIYQHGRSMQGVFTKPGNTIVMDYLRHCIDTETPFDTDLLFADLDNALNPPSLTYTPTTLEALALNLSSMTLPPLSFVSLGKECAVHACVAVLAQFMSSLPEPIVQLDAQERCVTEGYLSAIAARQVVAQTFRKREIGVFMYVCMFIKDMVGGGGRDSALLCRFFAPLMFQKEVVASVGGYFLESLVGGESTRRVMFLQRFLE